MTLPVLLSEDGAGGVRLLTLNRPKHNAFNVELMEALSAAMADAQRDAAVRAIVLRGTGSMFSAGLDLKTLVQANAAGTVERFGGTMEQTFLDVWTCAKPTVAAVTGHAIAAGFFLAVACDFRYVVEGAGRYGMNELQFGAGFSRTSLEIGRWALHRHMAHAIQDAELFDWRAGLRNGSFHGSAAGEEGLVERAAAQAAKVGARPHAAWAHVKAELLAPYLERIRAQGPEQKARAMAIYRDPETLQVLQEHVASVVAA